jgi:hypothetical protein
MFVFLEVPKCKAAFSKLYFHSFVLQLNTMQQHVVGVPTVPQPHLYFQALWSSPKVFGSPNSQPGQAD